MPKLGKAQCIDTTAHFKAIKELLDVIAKRGGKRRGDLVIAYEDDISVYAVRMWLWRPIPRRHWATVSRLSGYSLTHIEELATKHFVVR